jgi:MFS family permease
MRRVLEQTSVSDTNAPVASDRRTRALALSLWEGVCATVMLTVTETFAVPAAVALAVPALAIAVLGNLPLFLGALGQVLISWFADPTRPRRPQVLAGALTQAVLLFGCGLSGFASQGLARWFFVLAFVAFGTSGNLVSAFWISWMRDLAPPRARGTLFARRTRVFVLVQLAGALSLGLIARRYTSHTVPWTFFFVIFCLAGTFRGISSLLLGLQYEPEREDPPVSMRTLRPRAAFYRFCVASALMQGAAALSGPFFSVWFLTELHFDYLTFVLCGVATLLGSFVFLPIWGRVADRIGSFRLLLLGAVLVSVVPLPYLGLSRPHWIWALNFYSGVAWSAYNLGNFNTLLDAVGSKHADREIALAVAATGISVITFGVLGGVLATRVPLLGGSRLRTLFLLSALTRIAVGVFCFRSLRPLTPLPANSPLEAFNEFPGYRFGTGILRAAFRAFRRQ